MNCTIYLSKTISFCPLVPSFHTELLLPSPSLLLRLCSPADIHQVSNLCESTIKCLLKIYSQLLTMSYGILHEHTIFRQCLKNLGHFMRYFLDYGFWIICAPFSDLRCMNHMLPLPCINQDLANLNQM